jgi:Sigma-54 interaction domain
MTELLRLASGGDRSPAQRVFAPQSNTRRRSAKSPPTDEDLARVTGVNLLVVGTDDEVATLITSLSPCLITPIVVRGRGERLRLSPTSPPFGTIVIYDVDTLSGPEQYALNKWLRVGNGRARVVSSASKSLLPMVEAGAFNDGLYYRLNVVTIDLTSPAGR